MRTTAVRDGDEWVINGTKNWITNAGDRRLLRRLRASPTARAAAHDRVRRREGPARASRSASSSTSSGIKGSPTGSPVFEDVRVPAENVIGEEGKGLSRRAGHARAHAPRRRRAGRRHRPGRDRLRDRLREGAHRLRQADHRAAGASSSSSPTWRRGRPPRASCSTRRARWPTAASPTWASTRSMAKLFASDTAMAVTVEARPGARRLRLRQRVPGRADDARREDHADLRGHERDPARS